MASFHWLYYNEPDNTMALYASRTIVRLD